MVFICGRFVTDLHTSGVWYADSNGLDIKKRIYDDKQFEKVAGNCMLASLVYSHSCDSHVHRKLLPNGIYLIYSRQLFW